MTETRVDQKEKESIEEIHLLLKDIPKEELERIKMFVMGYALRETPSKRPS